MSQIKLRFLLLLAMLLVSNLSPAASVYYEASLSGAAENPSNASPGTGFSTIAYDPDAHSLSLDVTFSDLLGLTTVSHIHCCITAPGNAGVATPVPTFPGFPTGVTSGNYSVILDLLLDSSWNPSFLTANGGSAAGAEAAFIMGLDQGNAYLNIHSSVFAGGEIRGFFSEASVPEPTTVALLCIGLIGIARHRRES